MKIEIEKLPYLCIMRFWTILMKSTAVQCWWWWMGLTSTLERCVTILVPFEILDKFDEKYSSALCSAELVLDGSYLHIRARVRLCH